MMLARNGFLKKSFNRVYYVNKRKDYSGFTLSGKRSGVLSASSSRNCFVENGKLRRGHGCGRHLISFDGVNAYLPTIPSSKGVKKFFPLTKEGKETIGYVTLENRVDYYNPTTRSYKIIGEFPIVHHVTSFFDENDEQWLLICYGGGAVAYSVLQDKMETVLETEVVSGESFHERLFLVNGTNLLYGAPMNTFHFSDTADDSGTIRLPSTAGNIKLLKVYRERLYAFCDNGIWKIEAGGAASDFKAEMIDYNGGKIYAHTVTLCGEKLAFVSGDGIYLFDGQVAERIDETSSYPFNKFSEFSTGYYGGRLYMTFISLGKTRTLFFNLNDVTDYGECFPMLALSNVSGNLMYLQNGYPSRLYYYDSNFPAGEENFFCVKDLDFSDLGEKQLRAVTLLGEGNGTLTVEGGRRTHTVTFRLTDGIVRYEMPLKGKKFSLRLTLSLNTALSGIRFEYDKLGG